MAAFSAVCFQLTAPSVPRAPWSTAGYVTAARRPCLSRWTLQDSEVAQRVCEVTCDGGGLVSGARKQLLKARYDISIIQDFFFPSRNLLRDWECLRIVLVKEFLTERTVALLFQPNGSLFDPQFTGVHLLGGLE